MQKELRGMPAGRHGHKVRDFMRRIDGALQEERERQRPPSPPISEEHAVMRSRIERAMAALNDQIPEGTDLEEAIEQIPELADLSLEILQLARQEHAFLACQGVDPRHHACY